MGRYEIELSDDLETAFKKVAKEKTGRPPVRLVRWFIEEFVRNPDFFLDKIPGFSDNKEVK